MRRRSKGLHDRLEAALREVCVTIPEATVPEFEHKVNELILVSLTLAEHRKRKPRRPKASTPTLLEASQASYSDRDPILRW